MIVLQAVRHLLDRAHEVNPHIVAEEVIKVVKYLKQYGYLASEGEPIEKLVKAIKMFQKFYGLTKDGTIGPATLRAILAPRCGAMDIVPPGDLAAQALSAHLDKHKARWKKTGLRYRVVEFIPKLARAEQRDAFHKAFFVWQTNCGLTFTESRSKKADIVIAVGDSRAEGFDGPGGVLAWAYAPVGQEFEGQLVMKFDRSENWTANTLNLGKDKIRLQSVAAHEIGHLLGLTHSKKPDQLMSPFYDPLRAHPGDEDTDLILQLYPRKTAA